MSTLQSFLRGAIKVSYDNSTSALTAITVQAAIDELDGLTDDLITLSGVAAGATNLGAFTGSTISATPTIKVALQDLETAVETKLATSLFDANTILAANADDTPLALTVGASTFVGRAAAGNIQAMSKATAQAELSVDDLVTLSGVADGAVNLGTFTGSTVGDNLTVKAALQAQETAYEETDQNVDDLVTLSGVAENATDLGTFTGSTIGDNLAIKPALQSLETSLEALSSVTIEWADSVLDFVTDNTAVPATEVTGDRYLLSDAGGAPHANWDGASAGDLVEFNGTTWVATTPTTGTFASADDEADVLYYFGGASWVQKSFENTTASTGLTKVGNDIRLDSSSAGAGLGFAAGVLSVNVDDSTIEVATDTLQVKANGINDTHIDFGTGANQVSAVDIVIADGGSLITATEVEGALQELAGATDAIEDNTITSPDGSIVVAGTVGGDDQTVQTAFTVTAQADRSIEGVSLGSNAVGLGASMVGVQDAGGLITGTNVESALAENRTAIDAIEDNTIASTNGSISVSGTVGADDQVVETVFSTTGAANRSVESQALASTSNAEGASMVGIEDAGGNFTSTDVEGALGEIDTRLDDLEATGGNAWIAKTVAYTAVEADQILADTATTGAFTITLPATPSVGDEVRIRDSERNSETAAITVGRNGSNIGGLAEDMTIGIDGAEVHLVYASAGQGWSVAVI